MTPDPVLILASREAGGSLLAALLGAHPAYAAAPHLNVLAFESLWQQVAYCAIPRDSGLHGLLRFLAERLTGEQSIQSVRAAERWVRRRASEPAGAVWQELRGLAAPRALVDYGPLVSQNAAAMARAVAAAPAARVIHLTRDPLAQGAAVGRLAWQAVTTSLDYWDRRGRLQPAMDVIEIGEQLVDWSVTPPVFDPQFAWARTQRAGAAMVADLGPARARHLRREDLAADPEGTLAGLLDWLGAEASADLVAAMLAAGPGPFGRPGPFTAPFGVDLEGLRPPREALAAPLPSRAGTPPGAPLPWRGDGEALLDAVAALAHDLGHGPQPRGPSGT